MKKKKEVLKYRMYGFVPYNISEIQKAIQFGHAVVEYGLSYFNTSEYERWAWEDKTFIILNGGTTNETIQGEYMASMNKTLAALKKNKIKYAAFYEPDLNDALSAIVFLVDERVYDKEKYPDFIFFRQGKFLKYEETGGSQRIEYLKEYGIFEKNIGGKQNAFLRELLSKARLA